MSIKPGAIVHIKTALGETLDRRAVTPVVEGSDFPVIWVCREEEWKAAHRQGREPDSVPWPAEDVWPVVGKLEQGGTDNAVHI